MAQPVFSANVVGYINLSLVPGYNLVTVQLNSPTNTVNPVLGNSTLPDNSLLYQWDFTNKKYLNSLLFGGGVWYDASFNPATNPVVLGQAFFIFNSAAHGAAPATMTLVGEVAQGATTTAEIAGYGFYGDPVPMSGSIVTNGFPVADNSLLYTWNAGLQKYDNSLLGAGPASGGPAWLDASFSPVTVAPAVGAGFVVFNAGGGSSNWVRNFTVQ
jgi:hypothetical protein